MILCFFITTIILVFTLAFCRHKREQTIHLFTNEESSFILNVVFLDREFRKSRDEMEKLINEIDNGKY